MIQLAAPGIGVQDDGAPVLVNLHVPKKHGDFSIAGKIGGQHGLPLFRCHPWSNVLHVINRFREVNQLRGPLRDFEGHTRPARGLHQQERADAVVNLGGGSAFKIGCPCPAASGRSPKGKCNCQGACDCRSTAH